MSIGGYFEEKTRTDQDTKLKSHLPIKDTVVFTLEKERRK